MTSLASNWVNDATSFLWHLSTVYRHTLLSSLSPKAWKTPKVVQKSLLSHLSLVLKCQMPFLLFGWFLAGSWLVPSVHFLMYSFLSGWYPAPFVAFMGSGARSVSLCDVFLCREVEQKLVELEIVWETRNCGKKPGSLTNQYHCFIIVWWDVSASLYLVLGSSSLICRQTLKW